MWRHKNHAQQPPHYCWMILLIREEYLTFNFTVTWFVFIWDWSIYVYYKYSFFLLILCFLRILPFCFFFLYFMPAFELSILPSPPPHCIFHLYLLLFFLWLPWKHVMYINVSKSKVK